MATNRTILEEATRSVRRTFVASTFGSLGVLGAMGAAAAYGLPEGLNESSLKAAFQSLRMSVAPMVERAAPLIERAARFAGERTAPGDSVAVRIPPRVPSPVTTVEAASPPAALPAIAEAPPIAQGPASVVAEPPPAVVPTPPGFTLASLPASAPAPEEAARIADIPDVALPVAPVQPAIHAEPAPDLTPLETASEPEVIRNEIDEPRPVTVVLPRAKAPLTPAQRLGLQGRDYDKAEHCLAKAVYFEARSEPVRGQMAVAQVVLNRVFSPHYPDDVCAVIYQNAHRHLSCQFTFACDGHPETIRERGAWARSMRIARQTLTAEIWLPEVAKATHYHAAYVRPYWIREMRVMVRHGLHTFYRPRHWGDGSNEPAWGEGARKDRSS